MKVNPHSEHKTFPTVVNETSWETKKIEWWVEHPATGDKTQRFQSMEAAITAWNEMHPAPVVVASATND